MGLTAAGLAYNARFATAQRRAALPAWQRRLLDERDAQAQQQSAPDQQQEDQQVSDYDSDYDPAGYDPRDVEIAGLRRDLADLRRADAQRQLDAHEAQQRARAEAQSHPSSWDEARLRSEIDTAAVVGDWDRNGALNDELARRQWAALSPPASSTPPPPPPPPLTVDQIRQRIDEKETAGEYDHELDALQDAWMAQIRNAGGGITR